MNNAFQPLYYTIAEDLRHSILEGKFNPGDIMPSVNELALKYKTTRVTARKGLSILENEGIISVWHGKGYYVLSPEFNKFTLYYNTNSKSFNSKFSKVSVIRPTSEVKAAMLLKDDQKVILIRRTVFDGDKPVACDEKYLTYDKGRPLVEEEIKYADLPEVAAAKGSPFAIRTEMEIGAELGAPHVVETLGCAAGEPLLVTYRYIIDQKDAVIGYGKMYMRREYGKLKAISGYNCR